MRTVMLFLAAVATFLGLFLTTTPAAAQRTDYADRGECCGWCFPGQVRELVCLPGLSCDWGICQGDDMQPDEVLYPDQSITAANGQFTFLYQLDGNLVLYRNRDGRALWASNTWGRAPGMCIMQDDGNLVIYAQDTRPIWASNTWQHPGSRLLVQDDGNVVIYRPDGRPVWATNTRQ